MAQPYYIFVLKEFLIQIIGPHYPTDIIQLIIMADYEPNSISCGCNHTMVMLNRKIYVWGSNHDGRLGLGHNNDINVPRELILCEPIKSIRCGGYHSMALTTSNKIYNWGSNTNGQLGRRCFINQNTPQKHSLENIKLISCGEYHTIIVTDQNKIYVWGYNMYGQLGLGHYTIQCSPQELVLSEPTDIKFICSGSNYNILLTNKKIYVWGENHCGQLGTDMPKNVCVPQELRFVESHLVQTVACGYAHTIALTKSGTVYAWGANNCGQLGIGDFINKSSPQALQLKNIVSVSCGAQHTMALTNHNEVYAWGDNWCGQLGLGDDISRNIPHKFCFSSIAHISCGDSHTCAITTSNKIYSWGSNEWGKLSIGNNKNQHTPQLIMI